jgi:pimeloyl-ACP methyl ester carboxylesterase
MSSSLRALILILLPFVSSGICAGIEGKWAGVLESPGSIAALRLNISDGPAYEDSRLLNDIYGNSAESVINDLTVSGDKITFKAELSGATATFAGTLKGDTIDGTFNLVSGARSINGKWSVRRFDYSTISRPARPAGQAGPYELPTPTGSYKIGRRTFYWTNGERKMFVQFWYPADYKRGPAPTAPYIENLEDDPKFAIVGSIRTHAREGVSLARFKTPFPMIVFTPGLGASIARYTAVIENLASHGYAVVAVNPAGDAGDYTLPDGSVQRYNAAVWDQPVSGTWTAEQRKAFFDERRHGWASDMSFALDELGRMFPNQLNIANAGALGHSYGGQAISIACANDPRFKACVNLDGMAQGNVYLPNQKGEILKQPFLFFSKTPVATDQELAWMGLTRDEYDARDRRRMIEQWIPMIIRPRLETLEHGSYFAVARGATHASFTDGPLMEANQPREILAERHRMMRDINKHILAFFDKFLKNKNSSLLEPDNKVVVAFLKKQ